MRMVYLSLAAVALVGTGCGRSPKAVATVKSSGPETQESIESAYIAAAKPADPNVSYAPPANLVAPTTPPEVLPGGYLKVGFDRLATFQYDDITVGKAGSQDAAVKLATDQIPDTIKELDGKKVLVTGFMLAMRNEGTKVVELALQKDQFTCCYGGIPKMNDWILVKFKTGGIRNIPDVPISLYGTLHINGKFDSFGFMTSIYELDAERLAPMK